MSLDWSVLGVPRAAERKGRALVGRPAHQRATTQLLRLALQHAAMARSKVLLLLLPLGMVPGSHQPCCRNDVLLLRQRMLLHVLRRTWVWHRQVCCCCGCLWLLGGTAFVPAMSKGWSHRCLRDG